MSLLALDAVFETLRAQPARTPGMGRALMFIAARDDDETLTQAAMAAAEQAEQGTVFVFDLDLRRNALARAFATRSNLGPRADAALGGANLCGAVDAAGAPIAGAELALGFHRVGESEVVVAVIDGKKWPAQSRLVISAAVDYWNAGRLGGATMIVAAPALEKSRVGLRVAAHMDGVVLLVNSDPGAAPAARQAKADLVAAGANVMGLIYANARAPVEIGRASCRERV